MTVFGPPGPAISRSAIVHDPFDEEAFREILPKATGLRLLLNESHLPMANDLAFDLFCSFYKYFVKLRSPAEIAPESQGNRDLLGRALDLREHAKLRGFTKLKPAPAHDRAPLWALPPSGAPRTNPSCDARKPGGGRLHPRR